MFYAKLLDSMDNIQAMGYHCHLEVCWAYNHMSGFFAYNHIFSSFLPTHFHLMCQHPSLMNKSLKSFNLVLQSAVQLCCPFANHVFSKSFPFVYMVRFLTTYFHFSFYLIFLNTQQYSVQKGQCLPLTNNVT